MASPSVEDSFTFVGGLNTEGGFFLTPKNSWKEGDNVTPSTDGVVSRRKGIDFETNYQTYNTTLTDADLSLSAFTVEVWESIGGNGNLEFLVVQEGHFVYFYSAASGTVSAGKHNYTLDLRDFQCFGNNSVVGSAVITAVSCYGKLLITSKHTDPILVAYDETTSTFTSKKLTLKIRDFNGIKSPVQSQVEKTEAEWTTLAFWPDALYNLYNQGWTDTNINTYKAANAGRLPANSKQWWHGKDTNDEFSVDVLDKIDFGTSIAPKGRYVLNAFYQDRAAVITNVVDTTTTTTTVPSYPNVYDDITKIGQEY